MIDSELLDALLARRTSARSGWLLVHSVTRSTLLAAASRSLLARRAVLRSSRARGAVSPHPRPFRAADKLDANLVLLLLHSSPVLVLREPWLSSASPRCSWPAPRPPPPALLRALTRRRAASCACRGLLTSTSSIGKRSRRRCVSRSLISLHLVQALQVARRPAQGPSGHVADRRSRLLQRAGSVRGGASAHARRGPSPGSLHP